MKTEVISLESDTKIDPQEIIQPSTPIYKQIFNAHAREQVNLKYQSETHSYELLIARHSKTPFTT